MQLEIQTPPFFHGIITLLALYIACYFSGYILIWAVGFKTTGKIHREFTRLIAGYLALIFTFSIFITQGQTILLGLVIPLLFLIKKKNFLKGEKENPVPTGNIFIIHLLFFLIVFVSAFLHLYNPGTGNLIDPGYDCYVMARYCEHIVLSGEENIFIDWYVPASQGNSLYHYGDLWGGGFVGWFSGLKYFYGLYLVSIPFGIIIVCWAALSFIESLKIKTFWTNVFLSVSLIVLSPVSEYTQKAFQYLVNPSMISSYSLFIYPKLAIVAMLLL